MASSSGAARSETLKGGLTAAIHPLQRIDSPSRTLSLALHAAGLYNFFKCFEFLHAHPNPFNESYGWHFQFLTILGIFAAALTFAFGLLADLTGVNCLFACKNVFLLVAAPLEALVTLLFWPIYFYDPTLLVDPTVAPQLPFVMEMAFHFFPTVFLMIDTLLFSPPWETHALSALSVFSVVGSGYWIWVERCFTHNNFYPYPMLEMMTREQRMLLFGFATLLCWSSFLIVRASYRVLNGKIEPQAGNGKKYK